MTTMTKMHWQEDNVMSSSLIFYSLCCHGFNDDQMSEMRQWWQRCNDQHHDETTMWWLHQWQWWQRHNDETTTWWLCCLFFTLSVVLVWHVIMKTRWWQQWCDDHGRHRRISADETNIHPCFILVMIHAFAWILLQRFGCFVWDQQKWGGSWDDNDNDVMESSMTRTVQQKEMLRSRRISLWLYRSISPVINSSFAQWFLTSLWSGR